MLAPVVAALERPQAIVRDQAETIGELRATVSTLEAHTAPEAVAPPTGERRHLALAVGALVAAPCDAGGGDRAGCRVDVRAEVSEQGGDDA